MPSALITGVRGQDGAYLARLLLDKGYTVWGAVREHSTSDLASDEADNSHKEFVSSPSLVALGITEQVRLITIDYTRDISLNRVIETVMPDEVYNLAAQSSVARSFDLPIETGEITGLGTARLLNAIHKISPRTRFYQASSSEMFGVSLETPQNEATTFHPRSPYGIAKLYAHWMTVNYREAFGLYACNGILFNHESPLRPEQFVTRKICSAVARIKMGMQQELMLGNIEVERDWGFAGDYVEAMHLMLQQKQPSDYVIATGRPHSLREFIAAAFSCVGLDYRDWVRIDPALHRPAEVKALVGDARRAREQLGWKPKISFNDLVAFLVEAEMFRVCGEGHRIRYFPHSFLPPTA